MRAVNLIPAEHRGGASVGAGQSQGAAYAVLAMLAGIALLAVLYGSAHRKISSSQGEAARLTAQAQQAQSAAAGLAPYTSFASLRAQRIQAVSTLVDSRFDWAHAFHEFGRVLPLGVSVTALEGSVGATTALGGASAAPAATPSTTTTASSSAASAATPAGASSAAASTSTTGSAGTAPIASATPTGSLPAFTISGCATTQREVAVMLERLRLIDGVAAVSLQSSTKGAGGNSGSATCPTAAPVFTAHVEFHPLPAPPVKGSTAATVAASGAAAPASASTTTEVSAK